MAQTNRREKEVIEISLGFRCQWLCEGEEEEERKERVGAERWGRKEKENVGTRKGVNG